MFCIFAQILYKKAMKNQINYNFSVNDFTNKCRQVIQLVKTDIELFSRFGVQLSDLEDFKQKINNYEKLPSDIEFFEKVKKATKRKNEKEKKLKNSIRNILLYLQIGLNSKVEMKKLFPTQKVVGMPIGELLLFAEKVAKISTQKKNKLLNTGFTMEQIQQLRMEIAETRNMAELLETAKQNRVDATLNRKKKGGELYEQLNKYSVIGKNIWKDNNEDKYRNYLLYMDFYQKIKEKNSNRALKNQDLEK